MVLFLIINKITASPVANNFHSNPLLLNIHEFTPEKNHTSAT